MGNLAVLALRVVLVVLLAGSVLVQVVFVPLLAIDLNNELAQELAYLRVPFVIITVLGVVTAQVVLVCVWKLASMVRRGTVFSHGAFRYVDVIIGAVIAAAVLVLAFAALMAGANRTVSDDVIAPGLVLLVCGASVAILGVALVVYVLRMLLAQAVARADLGLRPRRLVDPAAGAAAHPPPRAPGSRRSRIAARKGARRRGAPSRAHADPRGRMHVAPRTVAPCCAPNANSSGGHDRSVLDGPNENVVSQFHLFQQPARP